MQENLPLDGAGVSGEIMQLAFILAIAASTLLIFIHLFRKKALSMDEEAKFQMFEEDEHGRP